jgi:hypothetical protein
MGRVQSAALKASGYETAGNMAIFGRWVLNRSHTFFNTISILGEDVGMQGTKTLATAAAVKGVAANIGTGIVTTVGWKAGTYIGSRFVVAPFLCSE